jgi:hypothetical protein
VIERNLEEHVATLWRALRGLAETGP